MFGNMLKSISLSLFFSLVAVWSIASVQEDNLKDAIKKEQINQEIDKKILSRKDAIYKAINDAGFDYLTVDFGLKEPNWCISLAKTVVYTTTFPKLYQKYIKNKVVYFDSKCTNDKFTAEFHRKIILDGSQVAVYKIYQDVGYKKFYTFIVVKTKEGNLYMPNTPLQGYFFSLIGVVSLEDGYGIANDYFYFEEIDNKINYKKYL